MEGNSFLHISQTSKFFLSSLIYNPWLGRSPGGGNGNALQYSCLGNPMDRGFWRVTGPQGCRVRHDLATEHEHGHTYTWRDLLEKLAHATVEDEKSCNLLSASWKKNKKVGVIIQSKSEGLTNPEPSSRLKVWESEGRRCKSWSKCKVLRQGMPMS